MSKRSAAPIFKDDSSLADRRQMAIGRLLGMCPPPYRPIVRPYVELAIESTSEAELRALLIDLDAVVAHAEQGDLGSIATIARRYGATEEQIASYLPRLVPSDGNG